MAEEKPKRVIDGDRRAKMLANLQKGRETRLANLAKKKAEMDKYKVKENTTENTEDGNKKSSKPADKGMIYPKKYACLCDKRYTSIKALKAHQKKCKYYIEKRAEEQDVYKEIETIAREKVKTRKKKAKVAEKLEQSSSEEEAEAEKPQAEVEKPAEKEVKDEAKVQNVVIPNPVIPPPPALVRQNAEEPVKPVAPTYTMKQWNEIRQVEEAKKQHDAKQKREEAEKLKLQKAIASMRNGGLGFGGF